MTRLQISLALNFLLLALLIISFSSDRTKLNQRRMRMSENKTIPDALTVIHRRKSVRHFTSEPVSHEQLTTLVRAGMAAPTGRNLQPWAFVAVTRRLMLDSLANYLPYAKMLTQAQAAIIVCGDMNKSGGSELWIQDCSAATQNILLAAEALGLGAVWTAAFPYENRMSVVRQVLKLPRHLIPLCVIPIGHPTGADQPKDKWKPENLRWEEWGE